MSLQISMGDRKVVCRTCLKLLENIGYTYLDDENGYIANVGNIREMLQFCIPELDLHVSAEPVICYQCLPILVQVYNFKIKCLNGESMIRAYISRNNLQDSNHVNLNSVLMEELRMQNQKAQIENRIKHFMIQEASTNNSLNQNHFRCEENFDEIEKSIFEIEQPTPIDQNIGNTPDADTSTSENSDDSLKSQIKREFDAYQQNENVELNADMEDEIVEDSTEEVNNKVNTTEKHKSVVAVRKDLFDKSKNKVKKQPVLSNKVITKNGRIIIKIDRRRLQNITKTNLNKESSISTPNSASQEATVDKDFQVNSVSDPDDIELSFIQVDESSSSGSQKDNDSPQIYTCNKCSFITHDMIKMYDHNRTFHNFDYTCQHCPFSTSKVELLGKHMTMVHPKDMVNQRSYKVSENFACTLCPFSVKTIDLLRSHHLSAHSSQNQSNKSNGPIILNSAFRDKATLANEPKILRRTEYSCDVCKYSTKDKSNLRKHLFTHGTKPLKCEFCSYKCVSPYQLRRHVKQKHASQCNLKTRSAPYKLPTYGYVEEFKLSLDTLKSELDVDCESLI